MADQGGEGWFPPVVPLPVYGAAPGPLADDAAVLAAFAGNEAACHSPRLHVEDATLLVDGDMALGLRLGFDVVMVRADLPNGGDDLRRPLESALEAEAMVCLDEASTLALPVALQVLGLRLSTWDLWGRDVDDAFAALRRACIGEQALPAISPDGQVRRDEYHQ
ncbi:MAG: hypothetical protein M3137_03575 [Actinomycetota bacterium]|nr:hypothetical protein [Actinomycetota bacterium]